MKVPVDLDVLIKSVLLVRDAIENLRLALALLNTTKIDREAAAHILSAVAPGEPVEVQE